MWRHKDSPSMYSDNNLSDIKNCLASQFQKPLFMWEQTVIDNCMQIKK